MNIAFFTYYECCPTIGGTERTTSLVAESLKKYYGYKVFSLYYKPVIKSIKRYRFEKSYRIKGNIGSDIDLLKFINENKIEVIINQGCFDLGLRISKLKKEGKISCLQVFALHFAPGSFEEARISWEERKKIWKSKKNLTESVKVLFYPLYYWYMHKKSQKYYFLIEKEVEKIVLLSPNYIKEWIDYSNVYHNDISLIKFTSIPNGLTFSHYSSEKEIKNKEKRVLIVARLDERQKKLTKALNIWNNISRLPAMADWHLDIVGDGPDRRLYEKLAKDKDIPRVEFHGYQPPESFYEKASLFMMTSDFEGFGMTLVEASQYGVVPIAINTFSSITDIITHGINGFIFEPDDLKIYENKILELVKDESLRQNIALNAVENSKRFSLDIISSKWHHMLSSIVNKNKIL